MYIFLTLFFLSLISIIVMIGKKLIFLKENTVNAEQKVIIEIPELHQVQHVVLKHSRKYAFIALVIMVRFYVLFTHFLKNFSKEISNKIKKIFDKYIPHKEKETGDKETSGFLKKVSEYKHKIRRIKHKIKEEEGIK